MHKLKFYNFFIILLSFITFSIACSQDINDPLRNGSVGQVSGGEFTDTGWKTKTMLDYIQYDVPTISGGVVEFKVTGLYANNTVFPNCQVDKYGNIDCSVDDVHYQLINFWDRDDASLWWSVQQWHNPYKMILHLYGYTPGDVDKWNHMEHRLNVCAYNGGYEDDPHAFGNPPLFGPFNWDGTKTYHHKLVWGNGHFKWYLDNILITDRDYSSFGCEYAPPDFSIRLGSAILGGIKSGGMKCPVGITYSDFKFYQVIDTSNPEIIDAETTIEEGLTSVTSDILITFNKTMNLQSILDNLTIIPDFDKTIQLIGNTLYLRNKAILNNNTTYSITVGQNSKDSNNNSLLAPFVFTFRTNKAFPDTLYLNQSHDFPLLITGLNLYSTIYASFSTENRIINLEGFWDNYNIGKIRFTPDRVGTWTYNINGTTGSFICVNSEDKGFIQPIGTNFRYTNGEPWYWLGDTSWRLATIQHPYNGTFKDIIKVRSKQYYTAIQFIINSYINGLGFWANEGGTCYDESNGAKDYNKLNPEYFRWLDRKINYCLKYDIVPIMFFSWGQEYPNYTLAQWEAYVKYIVNRYAAKNVIFIMCGEYTEIPVDFPEHSVDEFNTWGALVKRNDPYNHLLSLHPTGRSSSAEFANSLWMNFIGQQTPYAATAINQDIVHGIPVVNLEPTYFYPDEYGSPTTTEQVREQLYNIIQAGGYYTSGFYTTYAKDKGGFDLSLLPDEQQWVSKLNQLVREQRVPPTYEEYLQLLNEVNPISKPEKVQNVQIVK